jgi:transposase-like protein
VKKADRDAGRTPGIPSDVAAKLKALERENRELRQSNEILRGCDMRLVAVQRLATAMPRPARFTIAANAR